VRGAKGYRELAASREGVTVFENPGVLPRFRFVREAVGVAELGAAERGWAAGFDAAGAAMVERMTGRTPLAAGRIVAERVENAALSWRVATEGRALFVVADTWSPGWTATVDGRPARIEIVNGCMRGVFIETAGEHEIAMRFWPWSLTVGLVVTALGLLAAVSLCRRGRG
ncbi:MAG: YfhO family protein, partial [Acidobacteriota bacterium]